MPVPVRGSALELTRIKGVREPHTTSKYHNHISLHHPNLLHINGSLRYNCADAALSNLNCRCFASHSKIETTSALTHTPSENAPGIHPFSFLHIHREAIGIKYAMFWPVTAMKRTTLIRCVAIGLANTIAPSPIEPVAQNKTALTGVLVNTLMWYS